MCKIFFISKCSKKKKQNRNKNKNVNKILMVNINKIYCINDIVSRKRLELVSLIESCFESTPCTQYLTNVKIKQYLII